MHVLMGMMSVELTEQQAQAIAQADEKQITDAIVNALRSGQSPKLVAVRALQAEGVDLVPEEELDGVRTEVDGTLIGVLTVDLMRYVSAKPLDLDDSDPLH
ncbi:hypothetical protein [uncultured Halomonas sp.]|uniref:hypothetical protein n=1 Tax=uncultured Halomonas sp. TaxID=173971 RepID=UPI00260C6263|nr:hypothetical protein [uncultured Halomonas sp.]